MDHKTSLKIDLDSWTHLGVRKNLYDEVTEYWVVVRERGSHEQLHEVENTTKSTEKLQAVNLIIECFLMFFEVGSFCFQKKINLHH